MVISDSDQDECVPGTPPPILNFGSIPLSSVQVQSQHIDPLVTQLPYVDSDSLSDDRDLN